jgi:hypothetical protein
MRLLAISDLHLASPANKHALAGLATFPDDWLILAGDVAERFDDLRHAFQETTRRFQKVIWTPGNHELWISPSEGVDAPKGEARYHALTDLARSFGVVTPEDPYPLWTGPGGPCLLVPLFLLYDYSFRPAHVRRDDVVPWAAEARSVCADETLLDFTPHASREAWCAQRCMHSQARLEAIEPGLSTVLINHFPLREDLIHIPRIPRFKPWCGTRLTENWHQRFNAKAVVSGHLHTRRTDWRDGTRFEEVSLGYPRQWDTSRGLAHYLREILPGPAAT